MEFKRWVVYTSGEIQALLDLIDDLEKEGYDVILKVVTRERTCRKRSTNQIVSRSIPVAQLYKRKRNGELECLTDRSHDAQILLQVSTHAHDLRFTNQLIISGSRSSITMR